VPLTPAQEGAGREHAEEVVSHMILLYIYRYVCINRQTYIYRDSCRHMYITTHHVPLTPAQEGARREHAEEVVSHLIVGDDGAAVARGHRSVEPVDVVVLLARRREERALGMGI